MHRITDFFWQLNMSWGSTDFLSQKPLLLWDEYVLCRSGSCVPAPKSLIFFDWQIHTAQSRVSPQPPVENIKLNVAWFECHTFDILLWNDRIKDNVPLMSPPTRGRCVRRRLFSVNSMELSVILIRLIWLRVCFDTSWNLKRGMTFFSSTLNIVE